MPKVASATRKSSRKEGSSANLVSRFFTPEPSRRFLGVYPPRLDSVHPDQTNVSKGSKSTKKRRRTRAKKVELPPAVKETLKRINTALQNKVTEIKVEKIPPGAIPDAENDDPWAGIEKWSIPPAVETTVKVKEPGAKQASIIPVRSHYDRRMPMPFRLLAVKPVLIQQNLFTEPFWLLVATIMLNKTHNKHAIPAFREVRKRWKSIEALSQASFVELEAMIHRLGLSNVRAKRIIDLAGKWLHDGPRVANFEKSRVIVKGGPKYPPTGISHLPGMGRYSLDSFRLFCHTGDPDEGMKLMPMDKELRLHLRWRWAANGSIWCSKRGLIGPATEEYLHALCEGRLDPCCRADEWVGVSS